MKLALSCDHIIERAKLAPQAGRQLSNTSSSGFNGTLEAERSTAPNKRELLETLSERSKKIVELLKSGDKVDKEDWMELMGELRDQGAITEDEYGWTNFELAVSPVKTGLVTYGDQGSEYRETLRSFQEWPGDPLEYLDMWLLAVQKEKALLEVESRKQLGYDPAAFSGFDKQSAACGKVASLVRALMA